MAHIKLRAIVTAKLTKLSPDGLQKFFDDHSLDKSMLVKEDWPSHLDMVRQRKGWHPESRIEIAAAADALKVTITVYRYSDRPYFRYGSGNS